MVAVMVDLITWPMRKTLEDDRNFCFPDVWSGSRKLIRAECAAALLDAVGSSELSEEFLAFVLFLPILHGRRRWHARPAQLFRWIWGMRCSQGADQLKTSLPVPGIEAFCFWSCGTRACCVRRWVCAEIGSIRILRIYSQPPSWKYLLHFFFHLRWNLQPIPSLQSL